MTGPKSKSPSESNNPTPRPPNPYKSISCVRNFDDLCKKLWDYGEEWEKWGNDVLEELDALKNPDGTGTPPTGATQPPPPPFKKP